MQIEKVKLVVFEGFLTFLLINVVPLFLVLDMHILKCEIAREWSSTEIAQSVVLLICTLLFAYLAVKDVANRGLFILASSFFLVTSIREKDNIFDLVYHGFWFVPAILVTFIAVTIVLYKKYPIKKSIAYFITQRSSFYFYVGFCLDHQSLRTNFLSLLRSLFFFRFHRFH